MAKLVRLREIAAEDLAAASEHYRQQAGERIALEFVDAVERALSRISRSPQIGSLRFAYEFAIPDLRVWPLRHFPYVVFYVEAPDLVDIWRLLHTRRDIPATLQSPAT